MTPDVATSRDNAVTVSAVMPSYNTAAYLPSAIDSILNQTFSDWELLIVDDGSTDETASVLSRYTDPRIRLHRLPVNRGRSAARNSALAQAKGHYIAICDSDDVFASTRFEQQVSFLDTHPEVAVVSGYIRAFSSTSTALMQFPVDQASIRRRFDRGKMGVAHGASMVRVECFERLGGYCDDLSFAEDFELFRRFSRRYAFHTLPTVLLDYRHEVGAASIRHWAQDGCAHRYALYRSSCQDDAEPVLTLEEFSHQWRTRLAVYTLDLLRSIHFNVKARLFSSYVLR
ncbi:MAG: glycosyltransferase family A protein [Vicinamibacterales bacterium]